MIANRLGLSWNQQMSDEFTDYAREHGINIPGAYGCITGCKECRDFRNGVREAMQNDWSNFRFLRHDVSFGDPYEDPNNLDEFLADGSYDSYVWDEPFDSGYYEVLGKVPESPDVPSIRLLIGDMSATERITCALNLLHGEWNGEQGVLVDDLIDDLLR